MSRSYCSERKCFAVAEGLSWADGYSKLITCFIVCLTNKKLGVFSFSAWTIAASTIDPNVFFGKSFSRKFCKIHKNNTYDEFFVCKVVNCRTPQIFPYAKFSRITLLQITCEQLLLKFSLSKTLTRVCVTTLQWGKKNFKRVAKSKEVYANGMKFRQYSKTLV